MYELVAPFLGPSQSPDLGPEIVRVRLRSIEAPHLRRHDRGQKLSLEAGQG